MKKYRDDIFSLCSETERKALTLFCETINSSTADVFIIMAHKAVQLFMVLLEQNHIKGQITDKIIVSNSSLDFDNSYLKGKRIAIIDDIMISGTSIASTVNKLLQIGIEQRDISIITLATDTKYFAMDFTGENGESALRCSAEMEDASCIELSATISRIFAYYGLPYDLDFPDYPSIEVEESELCFISNEFFWRFNKLSNDIYGSSTSAAYILFPCDVVQKMLWKRIGADLTNCTHLKLRIYTEHYANGKIKLQIVPMCLFHGISEENLNVLYDLCAPEELRLIPRKDCQFIAKMRYLQYYIAHQLYSIFIGLISPPCPQTPLTRSVLLLFGLADGTKVLETLKKDNHDSNNIVLIEKCDYIDYSILKEYQDSTAYVNAKKCMDNIPNYEIEQQGYWINYILLSPFEWWYDNREIPVRKKLKEKPRNFITQFNEIQPFLNRLHSGFSLRTICHIFEQILNNYNSELLISLFIDRAIDRGIIVPTIYYDTKRHYLCRAYRHGEDLPFGLGDECRLLRYLLHLSRMIPHIEYRKDADGIAQVSFEKMIVLFYQMGIRKGNLFNRFLGFNNIRLLKPFLSLHGAIEGFIDPSELEKERVDAVHIYSERDDNGLRYITWLTYWLLQNKFIKGSGRGFEIDQDKQLYFINSSEINSYLNQNERCCISQRIDDELYSIAQMLAAWYNHMASNNRKDDFKRNATALTSCADIFVYASAIATEIHYFSKYCKNQVDSCIKKSIDGADLIYELTENDTNNIRYTNSIEQGLKSGRDKVGWYNTLEAQRIVQEVDEILKNEGIRGWIKIWEQEGVASFSTSDLVFRRRIDQCVGYLYFYSACFECIKQGDFWDAGIKPTKWAEFEGLFRKQCDITDLLDKKLFDRLANICSIPSFNERKIKFAELIHSELRNSEDAVSKIEAAVENRSKYYTVYYRSSLIIDIEALCPSRIVERIMNVWNRLPEDERKAQINIIPFASTESKNYLRYGFFYGISTDDHIADPQEGCSMLIDLYDRICHELDGQVYSIRAILLPDTLAGRLFEHNVQKNILENTNTFYKQNIAYLEPYFKQDIKEQLIFGSSCYAPLELCQVIKEMGWLNAEEYDNLSDDAPADKLTLYYNQYIRSTNDITYSVVQIQCGELSGLGLLIRSHDRVLCVTCNHVLQAMQSGVSALAVSAFAGAQGFTLIPIKEVSYTKDLLSADEEVAVLFPIWNGHIPYDLNAIVSIDDLDEDISAYVGERCLCFGPHHGSLLWSDPVLIRGSIGNNYYQAIIEQHTDFPIDEGFSGGVVRPEKDLQHIIGIHEGRHGEIYNRDVETVAGRIIPCSVIKNEILKLKES